MSATVRRAQRSLRFPIEDLAEIDRRARHYGLDRTRFLIDAALDRLPTNTKPAERLDDIERRLDRLEHLASLGALE